jgi:cytochrome P450
MQIDTSLHDDVSAYYRGEQEAIHGAFDLWRRLREQGPLYFWGDTAIVTRYRVVKEVLRTPSAFRNVPGSMAPDPRLLHGLTESDLARRSTLLEFEGHWMAAFTADEHDRIRRAAQPAFTPKKLREYAGAAREYAHVLLDEMALQETPDWGWFADSLPLFVITRMFGAPTADIEDLRRWSSVFTAWKGTIPPDPTKIRVAHDALVEFRQYCEELVERSRSNAERTDLVAALLAAEDDGRIDREELIAQILLILFAGHETTTNQLKNGLLALMTNRSEWDRLCADPSIGPAAANELIRYDSSVPMMGRSVWSDCTVDGTGFKEGTAVALYLGAANRDPEVFSEPDMLDLTRRPNDHLGLGHGEHYCLGGVLARLELEIGFAVLAERFPGVELAIEPTDIEYRAKPTRAILSLPISLAA